MQKRVPFAACLSKEEGSEILAEDLLTWASLERLFLHAAMLSSRTGSKLCRDSFVQGIATETAFC
jgi:hypothetical protein